MGINYDRLIIGGDIPISDNVQIHIPTIKELALGDQQLFNAFTRVFVTSVREQFSGAPSDVDKIEEKFPTMWDMAFDADMNKAVGQMMFGEGTELLTVIVNGIAYWTKTDVEKYRPLSNKKVINEKLDWIIDIHEYQRFSQYIKMITSSKPNEDLIAPKGISSKPHQCQIWTNLYKGRIRTLQKKKTTTLADNMLLLQAIAPSYISFQQMAEMNYYQFQNTLDAYNKRMVIDQENAIYASPKFDTSKMKLRDLNEEIATVKLNEDIKN